MDVTFACATNASPHLEGGMEGLEPSLQSLDNPSQSAHHIHAADKFVAMGDHKGDNPLLLARHVLCNGQVIGLRF